jgi:hypothetical protein
MKLQDILQEALDETNPAVVWFRQYITSKTTLSIKKDGKLYYRGPGFSVQDFDDWPYAIEFSKNDSYLWISQGRCKTIDVDKLPKNVQRISFGMSDFDELPDLSSLNVASLSLYSLHKLHKLPKIQSKIDSITLRDLPLVTSVADAEIDDAVVMRVENVKLSSYDGFPKTITRLYLGNTGVNSITELAKNVNRLNTLILVGDTEFSGLLSALKIPGLTHFSFEGTRDSSKLSEKLQKAVEIVHRHLQTKDIAECMDELIEAGLKEYAKL